MIAIAKNKKFVVVNNNSKAPTPEPQAKPAKTVTSQFHTAIKPENYFYVVDGCIIKDIIELADALEIMSDDSFYHHVTDQRNDFGNWVKDVLKLDALAEKMYKERTKERNQIQLLRCIVMKLIK